jgi:hypothetical protein
MLVKDDHGSEVIIDIDLGAVLALDTEHTVSVVSIDPEDGSRDLDVVVVAHSG